MRILLLYSKLHFTTKDGCFKALAPRVYSNKIDKASSHINKNYLKIAKIILYEKPYLILKRELET